MWKRIVLVYVALFVPAALVFGLVQTVLTGHLVRGIASGVVFGVVMSVVLATMMAVGQRGNTGSWSPRRALSLTVPDGYDVAHRQALVGLHQLGARVTLDDTTALSALTGVGWKTWGTRIDIVFRSENGRTRIEVRIRPRLRWTLIDYGAANRAVDVLTRYLTPLSPASS